MFQLFVLLTFVAAFPPSFAVSSDLDAVVVVFRHGDRTPVSPYPNDPYKNRSYWPVDWGMLTNVGKLRHYNLGQYFRQRYVDFLPRLYSEKDIYVRSTDVDRTLMSAQANLAGLYPPVGTDVWKDNLAWQPIPIHSIPENMDAVLAAKKPCPLYDIYLQDLFKSEYFWKVNRLNHDLYAYLSRYSGRTVSTLKSLEYLYNTLFIEASNNFTLPNWTNTVYPKKMQPWAALSFATATFNEKLARLKSGPFFNELITYFKNRTDTPKGAQYYSPKFLMYSAHDTTVANLLNSMGAFEYHCPPYTATIIFELHKPSQGSPYLNIFYKNTSEALPVKLETCDINCDFQSFQKIMAPITISVAEWKSECNSVIAQKIAYFAMFVVLFFMVISIVLFATIAMKNRRRPVQLLYTQLPGEYN
ncbi:prostatic acid phosphatase [Dendroctonus ponderosae]